MRKTVPKPTCTMNCSSQMVLANPAPRAEKPPGSNSERPAWVKNCIVPTMPGPAGTITPTTWMVRITASIRGLSALNPNAGARIPRPTAVSVQ